MRRSSRNIGLNRFPTIRSSSEIPSPGIRSTCLTPGRFIAARWEIQRPGATGTALAVARHPGDYHSHLSPRWPTCRGRLQPPEEFARTGPNRGDDVASRKRWRGPPPSLPTRSAPRNAPDARTGLFAASNDDALPARRVYDQSKSHRLLLQQQLLFSVPTRGSIWNNGQRTLHPISRPISPPTGAGRSPSPHSPPALLYPFQTSQDQLFMRVAALVRVSTALMLMHSRPPLT